MSSLWSLLAVSPPENREVSRVVVEPCSKSWISGTCRLGIPVTVLDGSTTVFRCVEVADSFIPVPRAWTSHVTRFICTAFGLGLLLLNQALSWICVILDNVRCAGVHHYCIALVFSQYYIRTNTD